MIPSFKTGSRPTITKEAYEQQAEKSFGGGKFIDEPGTYGFLIKAAVWHTPKDGPTDENWASAKFTCETAEGKSTDLYVSVPLTAETNFLYGAKKSVFAYEGLQKFLRGFGIPLDFDTAMDTVSAVFSDIEQFIGKQFTAKCGFQDCYLKYLGKTDTGTKQYQIVKPDGTPKDETIFADAKAGQEYAKQKKIKLGFCKILEVFPSKEQTLSVTATASAADIDLPF